MYVDGQESRQYVFNIEYRIYTDIIVN